jgi:hypothetical protein
MTERVFRLIDALTGEEFSFDKLVAEMVEEARQRRLAAGETTWPNGKALIDEGVDG